VGKSPERFATPNDELAYWMYTYNAWVIKGVLLNWPLTSVTDVKAPLEVVKGTGFFYQLRFPFGGKFMSLLTVENEKIRKRFNDPRIHFVLNCASESCPANSSVLPTTPSDFATTTGALTRPSSSYVDVRLSA